MNKQEIKLCRQADPRTRLHESVIYEPNSQPPCRKFGKIIEGARSKGSKKKPDLVPVAACDFLPPKSGICPLRNNNR